MFFEDNSQTATLRVASIPFGGPIHIVWRLHSSRLEAPNGSFASADLFIYKSSPLHIHGQPLIICKNGTLAIQERYSCCTTTAFLLYNYGTLAM